MPPVLPRSIINVGISGTYAVFHPPFLYGLHSVFLHREYPAALSFRAVEPGETALSRSSSDGPSRRFRALGSVPHRA